MFQTCIALIGRWNKDPSSRLFDDQFSTFWRPIFNLNVEIYSQILPSCIVEGPQTPS